MADIIRDTLYNPNIKIGNYYNHNFIASII